MTALYRPRTSIDDRAARILRAAAAGDTTAARDLLPVVYDELRSLAEHRLRQLPVGQTLQPTALVHEAYLKMTAQGDPGWEGTRHFFGAAARAMRQILVDAARRKAAECHGGHRKRVDLDETVGAIALPAGEVIAIDEAVQRLEELDPLKAEILNLRYFAQLSTDETASALRISPATIRREWRFIRAWLEHELGPD